MARVQVDPDKIAPVRRGRYQPSFEWGGVFEAWARNFIRRNHWRIRYIYGGEDDALQECAIVFLRISRKYPGIIEPRHMMALFKLAVINDFNTASTKDSKQRPVALVDPDFQVQPNDSYFRAAMAFLSGEARTAVDAIMSAPAEFLDLLTAGASIADEAGAAQFNARCKRLLRLDKKADIAAEINDLLSL